MAETIVQKLERIKAEQKMKTATVVDANTTSSADGGEEVQLEAPNKEETIGPDTSHKVPRNVRTRRLIQLGAIADRYLGTEGAELVEVEALLLQLVQLPEVAATIRIHKKARAMERSGR